MAKPIPNSIADLEPLLTEWRRDIHTHPEIKYEETRTAGLVADRLREFGFDSVETGVGKTGVVGILHGAEGAATSEQDRILLRADMDALPIHETTGLDYASATPGKMHACGHDGHTTMLLGAAKHLAETRNFKGSLVFCFQPAEEGGAGAKAMIEDGMLERHPVKAAYGMHNWPGLEVGKIACTPGPVMASADKFNISITGKGGHAAKPHETKDPIVAGAHLVTALQTIVSRKVNPVETAVVSVTMFHGGDTFNVIPETVEIGGTVRTFNPEVEALVIAEIERQCAEVGAAFDVSITFQRSDEPYPATINDAGRAAFAADVVAETLGEENTVRDLPPTMGGEDFSYIANAVPGAFLFIGNGDSAPLHHPGYNFNDKAAPIGVAFWARLAETALPRTA